MWQKELQEIQTGSVKLQDIFIYNLEGNLHKAKFLSELITCASTSESSWIPFSLCKFLSLD